MAYDLTGPDITLPAAADLSASQYLCLKVNSSGQVALGAAGDFIAGVLQNKPNAQGRAATFRQSGVTKLVLGGTVAAGGPVACDAAGKGKAAVVASVSGAAVTASNILGIALVAGVAGDVIPVLLDRGGILPTTQA